MPRATRSERARRLRWGYGLARPAALFGAALALGSAHCTFPSYIALPDSNGAVELKKYAINEVFGTLQGEGAQAGSPAVFLRFAGCNLGYEVCPWCDTDWVKAEHSEGLAGTLALVESAARATFGERLWLDRHRRVVPRRHRRLPHLLSALGGLGFALAIAGALALRFWPMLAGLLLCVLAKLWFCDRMVWLYEDMAAAEG